MAPVRVLVVDDSALMRKHISGMLDSSAKIEVCGTCRDGKQSLVKVKELQPDVVTLDVDMPEMSGLETIPALLDIHPIPIIMVSSLTRQGAQVTLDALDLGAVDFLAKPSGPIARDVQRVRDDLVNKVLAVAGTTVSRPRRRIHQQRVASPKPSIVPSVQPVATGLEQWCIVVGISTGGPPALREVFEKLTPPLPAIVIVQHMPEQFTGPFADRLNSVSAIDVKEAAEGDELRPNLAIVAPGGRHAVFKRFISKVKVSLTDGEPVSGHRPSVDVLFRSAAPIFGSKLVGVIMTGMGRDGSDGCKQVLADGGRTYGQDQASSAVYGMNGVAYKEGGVQKQFSLNELPGILRNIANAATR